MKEAKRNAPAANYCTTGEKPWPLTPNQWLVYYWLLAHSKWNYGQREDHYFIYDNSYKKKTIPSFRLFSLADNNYTSSGKQNQIRYQTL